MKIVDLSRNLITLFQFTADEDIKIEFTGLHPGEKTDEEGLIQAENQKIFIGKLTFESLETLYINLKTLEKMIKKLHQICDVMKGIVKTYNEVNVKNKAPN